VRVLYRADGGAAIGTGHVLRGLRIAQALRAQGPAEFVFLSRPDPWAGQRIRQDGWPLEELQGDEADALIAAARQFDPELVALDRLETDAALTRPLRALGRPVVTFDDVGEGRLFCRALVNILEEEPDPGRLASAGVALHQGPAYAVLPPEYEGAADRPRSVRTEVRSMLVTMGGGDPPGLSVKCARAAASLIRRPPDCLAADVTATVVAGAASPWLSELRQLAAEVAGRIVVKPSVPGLLDEFLRADLALIAGGLTMHEAMATGTPAIAICQEVRHQAEMAARFERQGTMVSLGKGESLGEAEIARAVSGLAADRARRRAISRRGRELVDGRGTERVARLFLELCSAE